MCMGTSMRVTIICSDQSHPIMPYLQNWIDINLRSIEILLVTSSRDIGGGDILFLVSCSEKITASVRSKFNHTLVLHASALPKGRGWSPHIWGIVQGDDHITLSLIEAEEEIDTGRIWKQKRINIPKYFLWDQINQSLFVAELDLMTWAIENSSVVLPKDQNQTATPTYNRRRSDLDSQLDLEKTIEEQFDLIRVCDPNRYPAFFEKDGKKFKLKFERYDD